MQLWWVAENMWGPDWRFWGILPNPRPQRPSAPLHEDKELKLGLLEVFGLEPTYFIKFKDLLSANKVRAPSA